MEDLGIGECVGEVVAAGIMDIAVARREVFEASIALDEDQLAATWNGALCDVARRSRSG